jgi:hypothetical protein
MPQSAFLWVGVLALLLIGVAFLVPAGYGLPGPIFGILILLAATPGLLVGWLIYRRFVKRGDIDRLGGAQDHPDPGRVVTPNAGEAEEQVNSFRRAAGDEELEATSNGFRERERSGR